MKSRLISILPAALVLFCIGNALMAQRRPRPAQQPKVVATRLVVQGSYEETYQATSPKDNINDKLEIKFEAARWFRMDTNEVGNAEFTELENAPARFANGAVTYHGVFEGSDSSGSQHADSNFTGRLGLDDIVLSAPQYADTGHGLKLTITLHVRMTGRCSFVGVRGSERVTSEDCDNASLFITAPNGIQVGDNNDPAKSADAAKTLSVEFTFPVEPETAPAGEITGSSGVDEAARARRELEKMMNPAGDIAWRGAVTTGSKEAGFKIELTGTKEVAGANGNGKSTRKLVVSAQIIPGIPR